MFINEMFLFLFAQAFKSNELTGEIIFKSITGLFDLVQNLFSLLVSDTWTEKESIQVSADSHTSWQDHCGLWLWENRIVEPIEAHVRDMVVIWAVSMVILNDFVEQVSKGIVRIGRARIATDIWIDPLAAREDAFLEWNSVSIFLIWILVPDILAEVLREERCGAVGELGPINEIFGAL